MSSGPSRSTSKASSERPGVLAIEKPAGRTSHDVVARVRRILGGAKVGHAGTLDPDATGVLVICIGPATKISSFLMEAEKIYEGCARLGVTTDTQDASGEVLQERSVNATEEDVRREAAAFVGKIEQVPPMYSAVKVGGQKLYRLARKGLEVERPARPVTIYSLDVTDVSMPTFDFTVRCSKGTYVRTLVHDIGERLGCGGHLVRLSRARQGGFDRASALPWEALEVPDFADAARDIRAAVIPPREALEFLPALELPESVDTPRANTRVPPELLPEGPTGFCRIAFPGQPSVAVGNRTLEGLQILYVFPPRDFGRGKRNS